MPTITFVDGDGISRAAEGKLGLSPMEVAVRHDIPGIIAECGGACATCHVYIDEAWIDKLPSPDGDERGMLEFANESRGTSRLSCQIRIREHLDDMVVTTLADQG